MFPILLQKTLKSRQESQIYFIVDIRSKAFILFHPSLSLSKMVCKTSNTENEMNGSHLQVQCPERVAFGGHELSGC